MKVTLKAVGDTVVEFEFEPKGISVRITVWKLDGGKETRILRTVSQKELKALLKSL